VPKRGWLPVRGRDASSIAPRHLLPPQAGESAGAQRMCTGSRACAHSLGEAVDDSRLDEAGAGQVELAAAGRDAAEALEAAEAARSLAARAAADAAAASGLGPIRGRRRGRLRAERADQGLRLADPRRRGPSAALGGLAGGRAGAAARSPRLHRWAWPGERAGRSEVRSAAASARCLPVQPSRGHAAACSLFRAAAALSTCGLMAALSEGSAGSRWGGALIALQLGAAASSRPLRVVRGGSASSASRRASAPLRPERPDPLVLSVGPFHQSPRPAAADTSGTNAAECAQALGPRAASADSNACRRTAARCSRLGLIFLRFIRLAVSCARSQLT